MGTIQFKEANCKNCYKCIRNCPVKAIAFNNEQASIIEEECVLCGKCLKVCPQNAKSVKNDVDRVKSFIQKNEKVYASIAPSFVAAFKISDPGKIFGALKSLGFCQVQETAVGAVQVSREYEKLLNEKKMKNIITTACPSIVYLIEKHYPGLMDQIAPVVSPMIAHARMMRSMYGPRIKVVFIGPCISKKGECSDIENEGLVDAAITFDELEGWMESEGINFDAEGEEPKGIANPAARLYPAPGGIIKTLDGEGRKSYKCISMDGIDRCIGILDSMEKGEISDYFIEMNSCTGGCLGGPCIKPVRGGFLEARDRLVSHARRYSKGNGINIVEDSRADLTRKFIDRSQELLVPDENIIRDILTKIGKANKAMELNCGACGYPSCREKAIAVYNRKAELYMCLPYMKERAESISNIILQSTPNAIFAINYDLQIEECNSSAERIFGIRKAEIRGKSIYGILNCPDFEQVRESKKDIFNCKYYYDDYRVTVEQSILYVEDHNIIIVVLKDITAEEGKKRKMYNVRSEAVDIAQKVIDKQMRVAQEIASLLGETTAETKVALTRLKKSMLYETGDDR